MKHQPTLKERALTLAQIAPLEEKLPGEWPEPWREIAHSVFVTLLVVGRWQELTEAELAMEVTRGVAHDMGGTQPYIPTGFKSAAADRRLEVLGLLEAGDSYRVAASKVGLTEPRVRKIEAEARRELRAAEKKAGR